MIDEKSPHQNHTNLTPESHQTDLREISPQDLLGMSEDEGIKRFGVMKFRILVVLARLRIEAKGGIKA